MYYMKEDVDDIDVDDDIGDALADQDWPRDYCDFCERQGHTMRACPERDDDSLYDDHGEEG